MSSDSEEEDADLVMDTATQLIDSSVDYGKMFSETCSLSKKIKLDPEIADVSNPENPVEGFLSVTCQAHQAMHGKGNNKVLPAPCLAIQVIELSKAALSAPEGPLLSETLKANLQELLSHLEASQKSYYFNENLFTSMVIKHDLPLEIVWHLHKAKACTLDSYLTCMLSNESSRENICKELVTLCTGSEQDYKRRREIISGFSSWLMKRGFGTEKVPWKRICAQILDQIIQGILDLDITPDQMLLLALPTDFFALQENIPKEIVKKFSIHVLSYILSHKVDASVSDCLRTSRDWESISVDGMIRIVMKQLFLPLELKDVTGILTRSLDQHQINTAATVTFLAVMFITFTTDAVKFMLGYITSELSSGLNSSQDVKMSTAFLLARQSSVAGQGLFMNYSEWFQRMFDGGSHSLASTRATFTALVKFLSSLVPTESADYLKVHIMKRPSVPAKCRELYSDYVALAKTRLKDLQVNPFYIQDGPYDDPITSSKDGVKVQTDDGAVEKDIERALESFAENNRIPTSLIEASIFRRPYFMGKFLPALLKPRLLPDQPDMKMKLIEELKNSGKLPYSLYNQYKDNCEKEKQALLEGVFDVDDEDELDDLALPQTEQLTMRLEKFVKAVISGREDNVSESMKTIVELMSAMLPVSKFVKLDDDQPPGTPTIVDLSKPLDDTIPHQVISSIIHTLGELVEQAKGANTEPTMDTGKVLRGIVSLTSVFCDQFSYLRPFLFGQLLNSCVHPPPVEENLDEWMYMPYNKPSVKNFMEEMRARTCFFGIIGVCIGTMASVSGSNMSVTVVQKSCSGDIISITYNNIIEAALECFKKQQEPMLRFCLDYVWLAISLLDAEEKQAAEADIIEMGQHAITEMQLLPDLIVQRTSLLVRRLGLEDNKGQRRKDQTGTGKKKMKQFSMLNRLCFKPRWTRLAEQHQPSLEHWIKFELTIEPNNDVLSITERSTFMWEMSLYFLQKSPQPGNLAGYCSTMLTLLAAHKARLLRAEHSVQDKSVDSMSSFLQLLRRHLLQLEPCSAGSKTWLISTLESSSSSSSSALTSLSSSSTTSSDVGKDSLFRLVMDLPPYLMFGNSSHEKLTKVHTENAVEVLRQFRSSSQNKGSYMTLDATIYFLQGYVWAKHSSLPITELQSFVSHPLLLVSTLVYKQNLEDLGLMRELDTDWTTTLTNALSWAQRKLQQGRDDGACQNVPDKVKGAALFVALLARERDVKLQDKFLKSNSLIFSYCLEFAAAYFTFNGNLKNWKETVLAKAFTQILKRNGEVLYQLLTPATSSLRHELGLYSHTWMLYYRDLQITRLAVKVPGYILLRSTTSNLTKAAVDAFTRIQQYARDNGETFLEIVLERYTIDMTSWLRLMIDHTSEEHLDQIDVPQSIEPGMDFVLRAVLEDKRQRLGMYTNDSDSQ